MEYKNYPTGEFQDDFLYTHLIEYISHLVCFIEERVNNIDRMANYGEDHGTINLVRIEGKLSFHT